MAWLPAHDGILAERVQFEISDLGFEIGFRPISDPFLTPDASSILMPLKRRGIRPLLSRFKLRHGRRLRFLDKPRQTGVAIPQQIILKTFS